MIPDLVPPPDILDRSNTRIVVDSTSNVPEELQAEHRMIEVPALVNFGAESYRNRVDLSEADFYRRFTASDVVPTTSQPPPKFFADAYRQALAEDAAVICVFTVAAKLSGTFSSAQTAAQEFGAERFILWDTHSLSMGGGWQAVVAARLLQGGIDRQTLVRRLEEVRASTIGYAAMETLKYAARSGRVGNIQAGLGDLLQVKPILEIIDSRVESIARVRGRKRSLRDIVERFGAHLHGRAANLAVAHAAAADEAQMVVAMAEAAFPVRETHIVDIGPAVASFAGVGALGIVGHPVN